MATVGTLLKQNFSYHWYGEALDKGKIIGAICNGASFLCSHGFLNNVKHTGNGLDQLKKWGDIVYTNAENYVEAQAVSDKNIVTAKGVGYLEFTREMLLLLEANTPEKHCVMV